MCFWLSCSLFSSVFPLIISSLLFASLLFGSPPPLFVLLYFLSLFFLSLPSTYVVVYPLFSSVFPLIISSLLFTSLLFDSSPPLLFYFMFSPLLPVYTLSSFQFHCSIFLILILSLLFIQSFISSASFCLLPLYLPGYFSLVSLSFSYFSFLLPLYLFPTLSPSVRLFPLPSFSPKPIFLFYIFLSLDSPFHSLYLLPPTFPFFFFHRQSFSIFLPLLYFSLF